MNRTGSRTATVLLLVPALLAGLGLQACTVPTSNTAVTVIATWIGAEEGEFRQVLDRFTATTGIRVDYQGTRASSQVIRSRVLRGTPPDVGILASPAELVGYARGGQLRQLDDVIGRQRGAYASQWLLPWNGKTYTIPVKVNVKGLIWYNRVHHPVPPHPRTWTELVELTQNLAARGAAPWCLGMGDAPSSGWPGSDMIESIMLHQSGPEVYSQWSAGSLPWSTPEIRNAWELWGEITASSRTGHGGAGALLTDFTDAGKPMFAEPPRCFLEQQASFVMGFYQNPDGTSPEPDRDFDFFPVPAFDGPMDNPASREWEVSADLAAMFTDTPQARRLIQFLASDEAQEIWPTIQGASAFTANRNVDPKVYEDEVSQRIFGIIKRAGTLCFDAADVMPEVVRSAFYRAVLEYLNDPTQLDELLRRLDRVRESVLDKERLYFPCGQ